VARSTLERGLDIAIAGGATSMLIGLGLRATQNPVANTFVVAGATTLASSTLILALRRLAADSSSTA
jgi:hypothetical protein